MPWLFARTVSPVYFSIPFILGLKTNVFSTLLAIVLMLEAFLSWSWWTSQVRCRNVQPYLSMVWNAPCDYWCGPLTELPNHSCNVVRLAVCVWCGGAVMLPPLVPKRIKRSGGIVRVTSGSQLGYLWCGIIYLQLNVGYQIHAREHFTVNVVGPTTPFVACLAASRLPVVWSAAHPCASYGAPAPAWCVAGLLCTRASYDASAPAWRVAGLLRTCVPPTMHPRLPGV